MTKKLKKLQIGVSRLENLSEDCLRVFTEDDWTHLGDDEFKDRSTVRFHPIRIIKYLKRRGPRRFVSDLLNIKNKERRLSYDLAERVRRVYSDGRFKNFYFGKGDKIPFSDDEFQFVYSEHFFEHLFFDDAISLFEELFRVTKSGGVVRTVVPDADLRTYEPPEPVGFPSKKMPFNHPDKHRTRWSVYLLSETLRIAGFQAIPVTYCDKDGKFYDFNIRNYEDNIEMVSDRDSVENDQYISRRRSLVVDGLKL